MLIPVIDCTDLYHPFQDCGDNIDILTPYSLPEIDLRLVLLDATERFRNAITVPEEPALKDYMDKSGPREPGAIAMCQLNYIYGRDVPWMWGPFTPMRSPEDDLHWLPRGQQLGIERLLNTLRASSERVHLMIFGSCRVVAAAINRDIEVFRDKVEMIHLSAGDSEATYIEWNVMLDPHAMVRVLTAGLPLTIYPCSTANGPFDLGKHNTFWRLDNLQFVYEMDPRLQAYLAFATNRELRHDWLRAVEGRPDPAALDAAAKFGHHGGMHAVWETAAWLAVSGRKLVRRADGWHRILPPEQLRADDTIIEQRAVPCTLEVQPDGRFFWQPSDGATNTWIFERPDPEAYQTALRQALPELYRSFKP